MTRARWVAIAGAAMVVAVSLAPDPVPIGAARLLTRIVLVAGVSVIVARTRAVDLSVGAVVGVGAVAGGVVPALVGMPALLGLPLGALAGAALGTVAGALQGRVGRQLGALATLALGAAVVAVLGGVELTGGVVGFHAVGLLTPGGDRADVVVVGGVALVALAAAYRVGGARTTAGAAVAVADPSAAAALGRIPSRDAAVVGAAGGAITGAGGMLLAAIDGSVVPAAYGLELTAALVVAAAVGGTGPAGPLVGGLIVWGPASLWPLVPVIGTWPALVTTGPLALAIVAVRRGRGLTRRTTRAARPAGPPRRRPARGADGTPLLRVRGTPTPAGPVDLDVDVGEVVAVTGRNGVGKSTLIARIAGQLPDDGTVELDGRPAPAGPRRRARAGVVRTWQRPPDVPADDARDLAVALGGDAAGSAAPTDAAPDATTGRQDVARLVAAAPRVALIDEPTALTAQEVAELLRTLAAVGTAVVVVDHRREVVAVADRVHHLGAGP